ncbi:MAG: YHYH protein [bacterium]|nr:YHYH protein [bacterium]
MTRLLYFSLIVSSSAFGQYQSDTSTFRIFLSPESCQTEPKHEHVYEEEIDEQRGVRIITANGIPQHKTGAFPNQGNPNTIQPHKVTYEIPLHPTPADDFISAQGIRMGVLFSGVELDPFTGEFFRGSGGTNYKWNITTLTSTVDLGLDCNNGHVQPNGKYHYHGTPSAYLDEIQADGSEMIKVGYAADGYPIYYKWGYNESGEITAYESGYRLKEGERPGDGKAAPDGEYDGTYFQDYEYVEGTSELDPCNGRFGKTLESDNEYYYVITDNFPSTPICFKGGPSEDFKNGPLTVVGMNGRQNTSGPPPRMPRGGDRPDPKELMKMMDTNGDGKIERSEARGPLQNDFDRVDQNKDGFLTLEELKPPGR